MPTQYKSYDLVSPHLENPQDFPLASVSFKSSVMNHLTAHIPSVVPHSETIDDYLKYSNE
ncbi:hypothetical protein ACPUEN_02555 [Algoriphagus yeomjeoni]|uniref:hypothetical protein n=1 Tax=Algoriphagus yeomjeoni TaxID=291403 RepID=UPI003CE4F2DA